MTQTTQMKWILAFVAICMSAISAIWYVSRSAAAMATCTKIELQEYRIHQKENGERLEKRLDKIDTKLDKLLERP